MRKVVSVFLLTLFSCCVCIGAFAENGYESIGRAISASVGEGEAFLLESFTQESLPNDYAITLQFNTWKNEVSLWGKNSFDQEEVTLWNTELCVLLFGGYCGSWEGLTESIEEGYQFQILLQTEEDGALLLIDNAEKAAYMHEMVAKSVE